MPVPAGTWARLEIFYAGYDKEWSNVFWYTSVSAFPGTFNQVTLATAFDAAWAPSLTNAMDVNYRIRGNYLLVRNAGNSIGVDYYHDTFGAGEGPTLPEDVSVVVQRISDTPGRSGRGRIYLSGWLQSLANGSYLQAGGLGLAIAVATQLKAPLTNQTMLWSPAVHSQKLNALHAITTTAPIALLATSRRRRVRF